MIVVARGKQDLKMVKYRKDCFSAICEFTNVPNSLQQDKGRELHTAERHRDAA